MRTTAVEIADRGVGTRFTNTIAGGALVALLSHLLVSVDSVGSRISMAYIIGVLLALGPFDHVIVTVLHVFSGMQFSATVGFGELAMMVVATAGNFVGGLGLVTFSHVGQITGTHDDRE